jgi:uncharacterized protein YjbI with pentapeptide repeats
MANKEHLARLKQGVETWNAWRHKTPEIQPGLFVVDLDEVDLNKAKLSRANLAWANMINAHLFGADLREADLSLANLSGANLSRADLTGATLVETVLMGANLAKTDLSGADLSRAKVDRASLTEAHLRGANLTQADLSLANFYEADLSGARLIEASLLWANLTRVNLNEANLQRANLTGVSFIEADLRKADLTGANLRFARLVDTNLEDAILANCVVFGVSAWDLNLNRTYQRNLIITQPDEPAITVDDLEVAQFIYLLLNNKKIRQVIDTLTSKVVLILGRFTPERKGILDAVREALRSRDYLPVLFDFEKPATRDLTETISTLAHMARFIIADITDAKSIPQELQRIIPDLPSVPVQVILQASAEEYGMFEHFTRYPWVLETYRYESLEEVLTALVEKVITPAELKAKELVGPMKQ